MAKKIKAIKCPQCGSTKQRKIDNEHFMCLNCDTEYVLDADDININHNYNYTNGTAPVTPVNKKTLGIVFFVAAFFCLIVFIGSGLFSKKDSTKNGIFIKETTWLNQSNSQVFVDKNNTVKLFIVGKIGKNENNSSKKLYWSVYNVSLAKTEQLNAFNDFLDSESSTNDIVLKQLNDGNIYFIYKKTKVYVYNTTLNSMVYLNNDLEQKIAKLKSGIGSIEANNNYDCIDIVSNTGAKISYFPASNLQIENIDHTNFYSNNKVNLTEETNYTVSNSNPNYLIQYQSLKKTGYPIYNKPVFNIVFNEKEMPVNIVVSDEDRKKAFVKSQRILNTNNRMHKLVVLGNNAENVAIAYKENIQEGEKYHVQLLDSKGVVKWNLKTSINIINNNNLLSLKNETFIEANNNFYLIDNKGKVKTTFNLNEITLDPKE